MKIAMHNWMRAEPVETTIRRLAKYGYDGIEISYDSVELVPGAPGTAAVREMLRENNLECVGSISLMFEGRDLVHADASVRESSVDYLNKCVTMIKELRDGEGGNMSIVPSEVGKVKAMAEPDEEWRWAVEGLKAVREHASAEGVTIAVEPLNRFETNFINRHDQALLLAQEVGPDVVADLLGEQQRLVVAVDEVRLEAVQRLDRDPHALCLRVLADGPQALDRPPPLLLRGGHLLHLADLGRDDAHVAALAVAQLLDHRDAAPQVVDRALAHGRIRVDEVAPGEHERDRPDADDAVVGEHLPDGGRPRGVRGELDGVVRDLDAVVAVPGQPPDRRLHRLRAHPVVHRHLHRCLLVLVMALSRA